MTTEEDWTDLPEPPKNNYIYVTRTKKTEEHRIITPPTGGTEKQNKWAAKIVEYLSNKYQRSLRYLDDDQWKIILNKPTIWWIANREKRGVTLWEHAINTK